MMKIRSNRHKCVIFAIPQMMLMSYTVNAQFDDITTELGHYYAAWHKKSNNVWHASSYGSISMAKCDSAICIEKKVTT